MIRHIVAIDSKRGFSKNGLIPWKLPTDEQYFTDKTMLFGKTVVMGRGTYEFIGHALAGRQNFVVTRNTQYQAAGATVIQDLDAFLREHREVWVIGGQELYENTLLEADELYITEIEHDYGCDRFYPAYLDMFELQSQSEPITEAGVTFRFKVYVPRKT